MTHIDSPEAINPFDQFETHAELFAFLYEKKGGEPTLRAHLDEFDDFTRESLEDIAAELTAMKLPKVAKIVSEFAAKAPSMTDWRFCSYPDTPSNAVNRRAWFAAQQRRKAARRKN